MIWCKLDVCTNLNDCVYYHQQLSSWVASVFKSQLCKTNKIFLMVNCWTIVGLTGKRPSFSWRSSTSFTSTQVFLFVGACQVPASVFRPGRQGRTLLANCRHSGHVNSPLSTEKPWRTWSFWKEKKKKTEVKFNLFNLNSKLWIK